MLQFIVLYYDNGTVKRQEILCDDRQTLKCELVNCGVHIKAIFRKFHN